MNSMKISALIVELNELIESALGEIEATVESSRSVLQLAQSLIEALKSEVMSKKSPSGPGVVGNIHYDRLRVVFAKFKGFVVEKDRIMSTVLDSIGCRLDDARTDLILISEVGRSVSLIERAELRTLAKRLEHACERFHMANLEHGKFSNFVSKDLVTISLSSKQGH